VVIIPDHSDCWATEFPDGRYLAGNHSGDVPGRLEDMRFLLDELAVLNTSDPRLAGRMDLDRIGLFGGSYGGVVAQTCRSDSRVKGVLLYDATNLGANAGALPRPFLVALGAANLFYSEDVPATRACHKQKQQRWVEMRVIGKDVVSASGPEGARIRLQARSLF
jgi:predicted dienelactone hydrolase